MNHENKIDVQKWSGCSQLCDRLFSNLNYFESQSLLSGFKFIIKFILNISTQAFPKTCHGSECQCVLDIICQWEDYEQIPTMNLDYTSVQQKIEAISTGGHFIYEFSSYSPRCESICNSNYIHDGCAFGHKCKIRSSCQNGHCVCTLGCVHLVKHFIRWISEF